jgi:formamidopyrimidine-DNA glycosylase
MRGQLRIEEASAEPGPYHCVTLLLGATDTRPAQALRYYDVWAWGEIRALESSELQRAAPALATMGEEPLDPAWGAAGFAVRLNGRRTAIKSTLLDQSVVAGIGNIYADESLFRARIHPTRPARSLTDGEIGRLVAAVRSVLTEAVDGGGTASEDYFDVDGRPGRFRPVVYGRGGEPCPTCGAALSRTRIGGRGTVYCASCQPDGAVGGEADSPTRGGPKESEILAAGNLP